MLEKKQNIWFAIRWFFMILAFLAGTGDPVSGYVIPAWKIVQMMQEKNRPFQNLQVSRRTMIFDQIFQGGKIEIQEVFYYDSMNGFRAEMKLPSGEKIFVDDGQSTITVLNNRIIAEGTSHGSLLQLFFSRRTPDEIHQALKRVGINSSIVSLGRLSGRVVIIIGAMSGDLGQPQLWVDKERLLPLRIIGPDHLYRNGSFVVQDFSDHFQVDGFLWFPRIFRNFSGNTLVRISSVLQARINTSMLPEQFSIAHIMATIPYAEPEALKNSSLSSDFRFSSPEPLDEDSVDADKLLNDFQNILKQTREYITPSP